MTDRRATDGGLAATVILSLRRLGIIALVLVLAAGCGFRLRTFDLNTAVSSVHISSSSGNFAEVPLRQGLERAGVTIVPVADEAEVTVALLNARQDRRSVAVTDQAQAAEYELDLGVQYSVSGPDGKELIAPRWVETSRIYRVDRVNLVGTNEEQALLEREMVNDLVQQIVRALDAATQELTVAS